MFWLLVTFGECACVQFDELANAARSRLDLRRVRRDEQTDFDPGVVHPPPGVGDGGQIAGYIQTALGCHLLAAFGPHPDDVRFEFERNAYDLGRVGHLQVEPSLDGLTYPPHIAVLDMAAVFTQMRRDPMGAGSLAGQRRRYWIRFASI